MLFWGLVVFLGLFSHPDTLTLPPTKQHSQCNCSLTEELLFQLQIRVMSIRGTISEAAGVEIINSFQSQKPLQISREKNNILKIKDQLKAVG